jgi:hypothetical protein
MLITNTMPTPSGDWLEELLGQKESGNWCARPFCTTCGSLPFRQTVWEGAARRAGVRLTGRDIRESLPALSGTDRAAVGRELAVAIGRLPRRACDGDTLRTLLIDLQNVLWLTGTPPLRRLLGDSWAGQALDDMDTHARWRREHQRDVEARVRREQEDRRQRIIERAAAHGRRLADKQDRDRQLADALAALARFPISERLTRLADEDAVPLGAVPAALLPEHELVGIRLQADVTHRLLKRIDRRDGVWRMVRRHLSRSLVNGDS